MTPERWRQIEDLYNLACDRGDGVLEDADPELRREVQELLAQKSGGKILDQAAFDLMMDSTRIQVTVGSRLGLTRLKPCSVKAAWARCSGQPTRAWAAQWRSKSRKKGLPTG
jgi:hypothetical protein